MLNMPELTPEEVARLTEEWETYCRLGKESVDNSNTLFPEYNSSPIGKNIYTAEDFTWKATRLVKGGLAPKGKVSIVIQVTGKCRAATLMASDSSNDERRVVAFRLREQLRIDKGI